MNIQERLQELRTQREELNRRLTEMSGQMFTEASVALFTEHPELKSFQWSQYTPYFNDGETCTFSVNRDYFTITTVDGASHEIEPWGIQFYGNRGTDWEGNPYTPSPTDLIGLQVAVFLKNFEDTDLFNMFGDHASITVHRNGSVDVDEYDHD
jgi:hypothetical protein